MAAMKLAVDRILPVSMFDAAKNAGGGVPTISINISSVGLPKIETADDILDVETKEY
jgi:hypothetical protein